MLGLGSRASRQGQGLGLKVSDLGLRADTVRGIQLGISKN